MSAVSVNTVSVNTPLQNHYIKVIKASVGLGVWVALCEWPTRFNIYSFGFLFNYEETNLSFENGFS